MSRVATNPLAGLPLTKESVAFTGIFGWMRTRRFRRLERWRL